MTKTALISVTDKAGIVEFAQTLLKSGYRIVSTGGTASTLREAGIEVVDVAAVTGHPEILDGRVKTLHPAIHAGILFDRHKASHLDQMKVLALGSIDLVCVNLYDFTGKAAAKNLNLGQAIEHVDVGGPTMLRAAAKNFASCTVVIDPSDYAKVCAELSEHGDTKLETRQQLAAKVFATTAAYDAAIASYFAKFASARDDAVPAELGLKLRRVLPLRYGENPSQRAGWYEIVGGLRYGIGQTQQLQGKELSYNNLLDLSAAMEIVADFEMPTVTIVKHGNPCGVAQAESLAEAYANALACDPTSAFGGIIACNAPIDDQAATAMAALFLECIVAPEYSVGALTTFATKKNLRIMQLTSNAAPPAEEFSLRSVYGGVLMQSRDQSVCQQSQWNSIVGPVSETAKADLEFAMRVCKYVKSNAIVLAKDGRTIGIGAGQMSRIDSLNLAVQKARDAGHQTAGSVLASDAFFPFRDCVDAAAAAGVVAIIQPGGSMRDDESIAAAREHAMGLVFTGQRHFRH
jgi:phosphoribosylaminoimidazolecarboxamide formyltransferase/IMP cyclohydrolase